MPAWPAHNGSAASINRSAQLSGCTVLVRHFRGRADRKFYRIRCSPEQALILVKYNLELEENRHYATIANFLSKRRIRVPEIYFHDATEGLIWLEDLGERDLCSYCDEPWLVRRAFYESALEQTAALHALAESVCIEMKQHLPAE